jgi:hypothetical protein
MVATDTNTKAQPNQRVQSTATGVILSRRG